MEKSVRKKELRNLEKLYLEGKKNKKNHIINNTSINFN